MQERRKKLWYGRGIGAVEKFNSLQRETMPSDRAIANAVAQSADFGNLNQIKAK